MSEQPVAEKLDTLAADAEASRMAATDPTLERIHLHMREAYQHAASLVRAAQLAAPEADNEVSSLSKAELKRCIENWRNVHAEMEAELAALKKQLAAPVATEGDTKC